MRFFLLLLSATCLCLPSNDCLLADVPEGELQIAAVENELDPSAANESLAKLIQDLGADEFETRRSAFLQIWQLGEVALPSVRQSKSSDNLRIAQAANALEPILVLNTAGETVSGDVFELVLKPNPVKIAQLCDKGYWRLAEQILAPNKALQQQFQDSVGTWFLNQIAQAAYRQNDPQLSWPIVRIATAARSLPHQGSDLSIWLATKHNLELNSLEAIPDGEALVELYKGDTDAAFKRATSGDLKRKIVTRYAQWSEFQKEDTRRLILGRGSDLTTRAAEAVLLEFADNFRAADEIWSQILTRDENDDGEPADSDSEELSTNTGEAAPAALTDDEQVAYQLIQTVPQTRQNQFMLALMASGRSAPIARHFEDTNKFAAFDFHASNSHYQAAFRLVGLQPDLSNFDTWLATQEELLGAEASRPIRRGGSPLFDQAAHLCNLLVGLGFRDEAQRFFDVIAETADTKTGIWEYSIALWMSRAEARAISLKSLAKHLNRLPTDTRSTILSSYFPEIENSLSTLQSTVPRLVSTGERKAPGILESLDHLHSWDTDFFAQFGASIADWLVAAERHILTGPIVDQPGMYAAQMEELARLAKGCGLEKLALQFATADLANGNESRDMPSTQLLVAAEILLERGDAAQAAELLKEVRSAKNAANDQASMVMEIRALLLSGKYEDAMAVDLSRWMRPLSVTRFYKGPYYSRAARDLTDRAEFTAAQEYAELAFQLSEFSSMDLYWAATDLARIHEEREEHGACADILRTPLAEALMPDSPQLDYQLRTGHFHFLRNAIKKERIHRAAECIQEKRIAAAQRHMQVGARLQPQDIEMVVACYPLLTAAGQENLAETLFASYETTMLRQIATWENDAMALNNLAWMYAQCNRKLDKALALSQRSVALAPHSAIYLDTLAEIHFRDGRPETAIETMKQCLRMDPRERHYHENLKRFETEAP